MRIQARKLLDFELDEIKSFLDGEFTLVFDDGSEVLTNHKETIYSLYVWSMFKGYPACPLRPSHHITHILNGSGLSNGAHTTLIGNVLWDIYFTCLEYNKTHPGAYDQVYLREDLALKAYQINNIMYNELTIELGDYVMSISVEDFIEATELPEIKAVLDKPSPTENYIRLAYETSQRVLIDEPIKARRENTHRDNPAYNNVVSRLLRSKLINKDQLDQCIIARGYASEINSYQFKIPNVNSLLKGKGSLYAALTESRSASKALFFTKTPLQRSEFYNRCSQLLAQVLRFMVYEDCGSTNYTKWTVRKGDLKNMEGVNYFNHETQQLEYITRQDTHLIGKSIDLRTPWGCETEKAGAVCSHCFGQLSHHFFRETNVGMACTTQMNEKISQAVLSTKHLDFIISVAPFHLRGEGERYFKMNRAKDAILMRDDIRAQEVYLVIDSEDTPGFADILEIDNVNDLSISRTSAIRSVGVEIRSDNLRDRPLVDVGEEKRRSSLTRDMLNYIKKEGFTRDANGCYHINMKNWDHSKEVFQLPRRHVSMGDHSDEIAKMVEGRNGEIIYRNNEVSMGSYLMELFDLVNSKLTVNLQVLAAVTYANMIVNADPLEEDYSLPKPWTRHGLGVYSTTIKKRSLGTTMAHQNQQNILLDPGNFIHTNRMDSPLDVCLDPAAVMSREDENIPYYS